MNVKRSKANEKAKPKEQYLKIPYHILNIRDLGLAEKVLLAHIYSFGSKGCWQSNETLGDMFFVDGRTISRWIAQIKKSGHVLWIHPKGRYRTIWVKSHPAVRQASTLPYMGQEISKEAVVKGHAAAVLLRQDCRGGIDRSVAATATNRCVQVRQNCPHTNNTTKKETIEGTTAPPSPLPAGGQAPAVLVERRNSDVRRIEDFKRNFGAARKAREPLSEAQLEQRRQKQKSALLATDLAASA